MRKNKNKAKSKKGALIKGAIEKVPSSSFEAIAGAVKKVMHGKSGIYVLYKGDHLYYVGLASNLSSRIKWHLKDKHSGKWDCFSIFIINRQRYLKDLESMIILLMKPRGNKAVGKIPKSEELKKVLLDEARYYRKSASKLENALK